MNQFLNYLDLSITIEKKLQAAYKHLAINKDRQKMLMNFLQPLKEHHVPTWEHSIRVGLLFAQIARVVGLNQKTAFEAGILHDVGKISISSEILAKTAKDFTDDDMKKMRGHVMYGYDMILKNFGLAAQIMVLHHQHQPNPYPAQIPSNRYSPQTNRLIAISGRILALADSYDAMRMTPCDA